MTAPKQITYNPAFAAHGYKNVRWIENVSPALRAIDISKISTAWYTDNFHDQVLNPALYALPHGRFAFGYMDPYNPNCACLVFDDIDISEATAARLANRFTERAAEDMRDDDAKEQASAQVDDLTLRNVEIRKRLLRLFVERKRLRNTLVYFPEASAALTAQCSALIATYNANRKRASALKADYWKAVQS